MRGYVITVTRSWGRSQHPGFWLVWKAPSGPSRGELAPPVLTSEQGLALQKPRHQPGPCPPTSPHPAKDSVFIPPLTPPKMEEVGLGPSRSPVSLELPGQRQAPAEGSHQSSQWPVTCVTI